MPLPSVFTTFVAILVLNALVTSLIYLLRNGTLIRSYPVMCPVLWWPVGVTHLGPQFNVTKSLLGTNCIYLINYRQAKTRLSYELEQFRRLVDAARTNRVPLNDRYRNLPHSREWGARTGKFQPLDFTRGYVVSVFIDRRTNPHFSVRVLYVAPLSTTDLYCQTTCDGSDSLVSVHGRTEFLYFYEPVHERCLWHQYILHCHFPPQCEVTDISVTSSPCLRPTNLLQVLPIEAVFKPRAFLGVCLNHIFFYGARHVPKIVNFFETFLHFGGDFIYLYGTYDVDDAVRKVLRYYVNRGVLRHYEWMVPKDISSLFYFAQVLQNMDCTYRHMGEVQHLIYLDLDEALYPLHPHQNYHDLISDLNANTAAGRYDAGVSLERINTYIGDVDKGKCLHKVVGFCATANPKPLVRPRYVLTIGIHTVERSLRPFNVQPTVPRATAVIFHLKDHPLVCGLDGEIQAQNAITMNHSLWNWYPLIKQRREAVLNQLLWDGGKSGG